MKRFKSLLIGVATILLQATSHAQQAAEFEDVLRRGAAMSKDLTFPTEANELSIFSPLAMAIYKPAGAGPFPAVLIVHTCGGLRPEIRDWTKLALENGYVAFVLDSLGPRGLKNICMPPNNVPSSRGAKDTLQALDHLKTLPFVDPNRIGLLGFSWGALIGALVSSPAVPAALAQNNRFAASVALYPMCAFHGNAANPTPIEFLRADTDKPLLILMGGEDNETPARDCVSRLEALKAKSAPVEWHLYPEATHCWDCQSSNNFTKVDFQGNRVVYRYNAKITEDSARRTFEFFAARMPAKP